MSDAPNHVVPNKFILMLACMTLGLLYVLLIRALGWKHPGSFLLLLVIVFLVRATWRTIAIREDITRDR